jgi:ribosomal protein S18 acetylase RimI-like enzyme
MLKEWMSVIQVQPATKNDLSAIVALFKKVIRILHASGNHQWDDNYPTASTFIADVEAKQLWIVEQAGQLAGVAAITTEQPPEYANAGLNIEENALVIHRLAVSPEFRGAGVASALMLHAEELARASGIAALRVDTNKRNESALRLFTRHQYRLAGEIELSFRPGMEVLCYEKRLDYRASAGR